MTPHVIDNFLPPDDYARLRDYVLSQPMAYGSKSHWQNDPHGHWSWKPVHDQRQNLADLIDQLPLILLETWSRMNPSVDNSKPYDRVIIRCYANGYTYGTDGYFHTDSQRTDEQTVIIYICHDWLGDWAGETVFWDGHNEYTSVLPRANRAVIAPSNMMHCARAVSRKCTVLRTTLMYKVRKRRGPDFERLSKQLVDFGALSHKHASGTLHDHLMRVSALLEARKLPTAVGFGGGLHSIYGTNHYVDKLLEPNASNRSMIANLFGQEAEALAYMFSVLDRPATLEKHFVSGIASRARVKLRYDQYSDVSSEMLHQLQMIEAANLADQNSLDKWPNLKRLWEAT